MPQGKINFETVPINSVKRYERNARRHSRLQIRAIIKSVQANGLVNPPLVDEFGVLIAGHGRLEAAIQLGMTEVPVIRISGLTEAQKRALRIADNRIAERSTWDEALLKVELQSIIELDYDVEQTGFELIEVDRIVSSDAEPLEDEPEIPPPPQKPISRIGDLWRCNESWILCGDARDNNAYVRVLAGTLAGQVITDFPYNVKIANNVSGLGKRTHCEFAMASGEMSPTEFYNFLMVVIKSTRDHSRDGSIHYYFMDWRSIATLVMAGMELFNELKNILVWAKSSPGMGSLYRSQHELIAVFKHGTAPHINNIQLGRMGRNRSNLLQYPGAAGFSMLRDTLEDHATPKPIKLIADLIRDTSNVGDMVLDPFGGSGSTLLAAEQLDRRAALIEIEPRFVDVTLRRFQEATGIEPVLMPEGTPLSAVRRQRDGEI